MEYMLYFVLVSGDGPLLLGLSQVHYSANLPEAQLPVRLLCYDLPHLSAGVTGDLYTLRLALFRITSVVWVILTSKSTETAPAGRRLCFFGVGCNPSPPSYWLYFDLGLWPRPGCLRLF